ncbi:MAG: type II secretion system F family protein [Gammaproteobacteria bacterium]
MTNVPFVYLASGLGIFGLMLLVLSLLRSEVSNRSSERRFQKLLKAGLGHAGADESWFLPAMERMGGQRVFFRWLTASDEQETARLLRQAGWHGGVQRTVYYLVAWLSPLIITAAVVAYVVSTGIGGFQAFAGIVIGFVLGFLLPKNVVRFVANGRRKALSTEVSTAIHLLRMLLDAGLSMEHALWVLHSESKALLPNLSAELAVALQKINAGHDRVDALSDMATPLEVPELTDTVAILKQVTRHGGNIRDSLLQFAHLMDERQQSALREYVSKLSAKMTAVMVVFLFPALMIFLAGPGFLALAKALIDVQN